jgi:Protein of unknown function (DUF3800)
MYFIYLDEAGNTGKDLDNEQQPFHFISGIILHESKMQSIENDVKFLLPDLLPYSQNFDFELHASDIIAGKSYFKHYKLKQRLELMSKIVDIALKHEIIIYSQGVNKQKHKLKYLNPFHPHNVCFMYLIEKLDKFLEAEKKKGIIIMDKCESVEQSIIDDCKSYRNKGTSYGFIKRDIKNIVDNVMYANSYNSCYIQLADCLTYIYTSTFTNDYNKNNNSYVRKYISNLYEKIKPMVKYKDIEPKK